MWPFKRKRYVEPYTKDRLMDFFPLPGRGEKKGKGQYDPAGFDP